MTQKPLISVITPCFNRAHLIKGLIERIYAQTFSDWELVIADDGSTDNLTEIMKPFLSSSSKIIYRSQPNGGVSSARNFAVAHANGSYLFFLDSDDRIHPDTLNQFAIAIEQTGADLVFCSCRMIKDGVPKIKRPYDHGKAFKHIRALFLAGAFCVKKEIFLKAGGYSTALKFSENYELGLRISQLSSKAVTIDHIGVDYVIDTGVRVSNSISNKLDGNMFLLTNHYDILKTDPDLLATTLSQTGYFLAAQGKKTEARKMYWRSFRIKPVNLRNLYRFFRTLI